MLGPGGVGQSRRDDAAAGCRDTLRGMYSAPLRRLCTWMALWVMVLGAVQPALAQAWRGAQDTGHWVQVCSTSGMFWVRTDVSEAPAADADGGPSVPGHPSMASAGHCPICLGHGAAGLPPDTGPASIPRSPGFDRPIAFLGGQPNGPLLRPLSRGPPAA